MGIEIEMLRHLWHVLRHEGGDTSKSTCVILRGFFVLKYLHVPTDKKICTLDLSADYKWRGGTKVRKKGGHVCNRTGNTLGLSAPILFIMQRAGDPLKVEQGDRERQMVGGDTDSPPSYNSFHALHIIAC